MEIEPRNDQIIRIMITFDMAVELPSPVIEMNPRTLSTQSSFASK